MDAFTPRILFRNTLDYIDYLLVNRDKLKTLAKVAEIDSTQETAAQIIESIVLRAHSVEDDKIQSNKISDPTPAACFRYPKIMEEIKKTPKLSPRQLAMYINAEYLKLEYCIDQMSEINRTLLKLLYYEKKGMLEAAKIMNRYFTKLYDREKQAKKELAALFDHELPDIEESKKKQHETHYRSKTRRKRF